MTDLKMRLIEWINNWVSPPEHLRVLDDAKTSVAGYQRWESVEAVAVIKDFSGFWEITDKRVLDLGSGLGGKAVYYATLNPSSVHALEIRPFSSLETIKLAQERGTTRVIPINGDAAALPYPDNSFDVIVSVNVLEHVDHVFETLRECKRVLKPGGRIYFHFPPFYSPWGPHLEGWINFPWPHLFFSDASLLKAAAQIEERLQLNQHYIPTAQVHWHRHTRLPELNRVTVSQFTRYLRELEFEVINAEMLPFGRHTFAQGNLFFRMLYAVLRPLTKVPLLREAVTTKMVFVLGKGQPL